MTAHRTLTVAVLASAAVAGVVGGVPLLAVASRPQISAAPALRTPVIPANLDDFSKNAAYAALYKQKITWSPSKCPQESLRAGGVKRAAMECATVVVPKDWNAPKLGTIAVGVSRPVGGNPRARLLLTNPGGPGAPGLGFSMDVAESLGLMTTHLPVGIDPRGTGMSTQAVCTPAKKTIVKVKDSADPRTFTPAFYAASLKAAFAAAQACAKKSGSLTPYLNSVQTARDFNFIRHLLGYRKADYVGSSYGTWLGVVMGKMFPHSFDRLVLDANADFASNNMGSIYAYQPEAFQAAYDRALVPWLARHHARFALGTTPVAVHATIEKIRAATSRRFFGPQMTPMVFDETVSNAAAEIGQRTHASIPLLTLMAKRLRENKPGLPVPDAPKPPTVKGLLSSPGDSNGVLFNSVICNDTGPWNTVSDELKRIAANSAKYPLLGYNHFGAPCLGRPGIGAVTPSILARPIRQALMTQTEDDPNTLYRGGYASRHRAAGTLRMVALDNGHGHGAYAQPCVVAHVKKYMLAGNFPAKDVRCLAGPLLYDTVAYEFFHASSPASPLPAPFTYARRDLSPAHPVQAIKDAVDVDSTGPEDHADAREQAFRDHVRAQLTRRSTEN